MPNHEINAICILFIKTLQIFVSFRGLRARTVYVYYRKKRSGQLMQAIYNFIYLLFFH